MGQTLRDSHPCKHGAQGQERKLESPFAECYTVQFSSEGWLYFHEKVVQQCELRTVQHGKLLESNLHLPCVQSMGLFESGSRVSFTKCHCPCFVPASAGLACVGCDLSRKTVD